VSESYVHRSVIDADASDVFALHARPGALERLTPPWLDFHLVERHGGITPGSRVIFDVPVGPLSVRWIAEHRDYMDGRYFQDVQLSGPFKRWVHDHVMEPAGKSTVLEDRVEYTLPMHSVANAVAGSYVRGELERLFRHRHEVIAADIERHSRYSRNPLTIAVSGSSGLVGSALVPFLTTAGHEVRRMIRSSSQVDSSEDIGWDPEHGQVNPSRLRGVDAVVHLAGAEIGRRWTAEVREEVRRSRVDGTRLLARTLATLPEPPRVLVCASAMGYYGSRGEEWLDERSSRGDGFLADVVEEWEEAAEPARKAGIRVVHARFGLVLSPSGGALKRLLTPFRFAVGGRLGSGEQWMSWIALDDCLGAIEHCIHTGSLEGPVNTSSPEPVTNREFTETLGDVLHRPAMLPVPATALRLVFGEMANQTLLASQRMVAGRLKESGFRWRYPRLEEALQFELGRM
jgi:uncharacterized protein